MNKSVVILKYPAGKKSEAEVIKKEIEDSDHNFTVVLVDERMQVEVLPSLY